MTTVYKFKAYYTDAGVGTAQDPAPVCTVINMADDSKLADAQATTASTNMPGLYSYEYSGADGLDCVAFFATTDTGCDVKQLASYVSEKITTNLNADVAGMEAKLDTVGSNVDAILADTGTDGVVLTAAAVDAILDEVVVGTYTMRQMLTVMGAALAGKLSGGGTTTLTFRGIDDASNVIVATVDASGNRSAVTINV